ncbi:MAG TPA: glycosyltransferase family 4 protein [Planctomycetota bacterium]|nr:glycosyltransferase family 4 protein [Planctomycetota bacterium]
MRGDQKSSGPAPPGLSASVAVWARKPALKVLFTPVEDNNPYQRLLAGGLAAHGIDVTAGHLSPRKYLLGKQKVEQKIIHLHWLQPFYNEKSRSRSWLRSRAFVQAVKGLRAAGCRIVWTIHNLLPHDMIHPAIDVWVRRRMHLLADALILHTTEARKEYVKMFGKRRGLFVVPHGVYAVSLVPMPDRAESREYFNLPKDDTIVALQFGMAREYKGFDRVAKALSSFSKHGAHAVFAGPGHAEKMDVTAAAESGAASILSYYIPEYELPPLFAAADVLMLAYRNCTTSGLALLGLGFGLPIVCSNMGPFPSMCSQKLGVICTDPDDPDQLAQAVVKAKELAADPGFTQARKKLLAESNWSRLAKATAKVYDYALKNNA